MTIDKSKITITLENEEVMDFWNVVMFALDYDKLETEKGNVCMHESERELATRLVEALKRE